MIRFHWYVVFILGIVALNCQAQNIRNEDLRMHHAFVSSQMLALNTFLKNNGLSDSLIHIDSISVYKNRALLQGFIRDKWNLEHLDSISLKSFNESFYKILFKKVLFACDLRPDQLEIKLSGSDLIVFISAINDSITEDISSRMGGIGADLEIPIGNISGLSNMTTLKASSTISKVKSGLTNSLKNHYTKYKHWWATFIFIPMDQNNDKIIFRVENIKGPILKGSFFEKIEIEFDFEIKDDILYVNYQWMAKYGSGIFKPYSEDYKDISIYYNEAMQSYSKELHSVIYTSITSLK